MDISEARKKLVLTLKTIVGPINEFLDKRIRHFERRFEDLKETESRQDRIENDCVKRFGLTKEEMGKLHMFFSPLMVFDRLSESQVRFCIMLYDLIYAPETLIRDGKLIILYDAMRSKDAMSLGDDFPKVLESVFKAKLGVKGEMQKSNNLWKMQLKSMTKTEREEFLREFGARLPFLFELNDELDD